MEKAIIKPIKIPLRFIGDTLSSNSNPGKSFSKSATINFLYYKNYSARLAFKSG
jgi:hypothetical protein